jgi:hypothetical protein
MNLRPVLWISRVLNLCLVAVVVWLVRRHTALDPKRSELPLARAETVQPVAEIQPKQSNPPTSAPFHWSRIASNDLKVYRDNLYAIGCPRSTVRDIIVAEINNRFEVRRQNLLASLQGRFWDFAIRGEAAMRAEWGQPLEDLNTERQQMMHDVLGKDYDADETDGHVSLDSFNRRHAWLPAEKGEKLWALEQQQRRNRMTLDESMRGLSGLSDEQVGEEIPARVQAIDEEYEAARKELLTPEELEELQLRESEESHWAEGLSGFSPTEEQWQAVTKLRMAYREKMNELGGEPLGDDERKQRAEKLDNELKQSMKEVLGEEYDHYQLASDGNFQEAQRVTQRYGLPNTLAEQAYQLQKNALAAADAVRGDATLSDDERQARLTALRQKTEHDLAQTLGDKVFSTYKEYAGAWLKTLNRSGTE